MVNTARMSLSLPADKLAATLSVASSLLARRSCKVRHLQSLLGRLQWASRVVYGGKAFMRSLSDALVGARHPSHHVSISASMKADLMWWLQFASAHNGLLRLSPAVSTHIVYTDACLAPIPCVGIFSAGAFAAFTARQLASFDDVPLVVDVDNINLWECLAVYMALAAYPEVFSTSRVVVYCDNAATGFLGDLPNLPQPGPLSNRYLPCVSGCMSGLLSPLLRVWPMSWPMLCLVGSGLGLALLQLQRSLASHLTCCGFCPPCRHHHDPSHLSAVWGGCVIGGQCPC